MNQDGIMTSVYSERKGVGGGKNNNARIERLYHREVGADLRKTCCKRELSARARKREKGTGEKTKIEGHYLEGCTSRVKEGERPNERSYQ